MLTAVPEEENINSKRIVVLETATIMREVMEEACDRLVEKQWRRLTTSSVERRRMWSPRGFSKSHAGRAKWRMRSRFFVGTQNLRATDARELHQEGNIDATEIDFVMDENEAKAQEQLERTRLT